MKVHGKEEKNTHKSCNLFKFDFEQLYKIKDILGIESEKNLQIELLQFDSAFYQKLSLISLDLI